MASSPSFRWNVVAFAAIVVLIALASIGLLVLLDPRSQGWWGERFEAIGTVVRAILDAIGIRG